MQLLLNRPIGSNNISPIGSPALGAMNIGLNMTNMHMSSSFNNNHHHHHHVSQHTSSIYTNNTSNNNNNANRASDKDVAPFLKSLRTMLDDESDAVLCWTRDGRAFEIHDMEEMMASVLPKYFKHRKYTSFQRQLNYFNFRKWTKSKAAVCTFSNDNFVRDAPELACRITRKKSLHHHSSSSSSSNSNNSSSNSSSQSQRSSSLSFTASGANKLRSSSSSRVLSIPPFNTVTHTHSNNSNGANPFWLKHDGVVISVPRTSSFSGDELESNSYSYSGGRSRSASLPFPSPTDQDMMLKEHDQHFQQHQLSTSGRRHYYTYPLQAHHSHTQARVQQQQQSHEQYTQQQQQQQHAGGGGPESLDWIECLLPPVDRIEDEIYSYMYPAAMQQQQQQVPATSVSFEFASTSL